MTQFLAEVYIPRGDADGLRRAAARVCAAAGALTAGGTHVRHVLSLYVLEDETCLPGFDAPSAAAVETAADWAELFCNRVVEFHGVELEEDVR